MGWMISPYQHPSSTHANRSSSNNNLRKEVSRQWSSHHDLPGHHQCRTQEYADHKVAPMATLAKQPGQQQRLA